MMDKIFRFRNKAHREKWTQTRRKGFLRYFVIYGLVSMGAPFALLTYLVENLVALFIDGKFHDHHFLFYKVVGGILFGSIMALIIWFGSEWAYRTTPEYDEH